MHTTSPYLSSLLEKATNGSSISRNETTYLLGLNDPEAIQQVITTARDVCRRNFGNRVFLYGFLYFSTYCRNQCAFCFYRQSNTRSPRYRKNLDDVVHTACGLVDSGVHLVDLTMGEDPLLHESGFQTLLKIIARIKQKTGIPIMVSPGVVPDYLFKEFSKREVDWYALYQETHNPTLFQKLRINQDYELRNKKRVTAHQAGMLVEDGILIGIGESVADRADSIMTMKGSLLDQVRVMSFVPQPDTPLAGTKTLPRINEILCIAAMRLAMPERLIPASLDVDGLEGLKMRLEAGANVVTSIIPPSNTLAGVAQTSLDVEEGRRTVREVMKILSQMDLVPAGRDDYEYWIKERKRLFAPVP